MKSALIALLFSFTFAAAPAAAPSACNQQAHQWIAALQSPKETILQRHSAASCAFAAEYVREIDGVAEKQGRERTCYHLVLLWAHKDCVYFRDVIDPTAYSPCKEWTREMFRQCMAGNTVWFLAGDADG